MNKLKKIEKNWLQSERKQNGNKVTENETKIEERLQQEVWSMKCVNTMNKLFNEDLIKILTIVNKKIPHWNNDTLIKAYCLKFACGSYIKNYVK